jgi:DeoR/GlpR family transcriptional regulator of sugar metabolism
MTFNERKEKLSYLLYLLEHNRLCALDCVAEKLNCSEKTIRRMLNDLRNEGYIIGYDRLNKKYFLEK